MRLGGLRFDWQRDSICWVGLQGWDALPAGLMHSKLPEGLPSPKPSPLNYRYNSSSETFSLLSRTCLTNISVWAVSCAQVGKKRCGVECVIGSMQNQPMHAFFSHVDCKDSESWIVDSDMSDFILGIYCWQLGVTYQKLSFNSWYFSLCFRVNVNIC